MGKSYAPEEIPEVGVTLNAGRYLFNIDSVEDDQKTSTGKYMIKVSLRVLEPAVSVGFPFTENFVIGNDDDPEADDPQSWKAFAARRYKSMMESAGVAMTGDVEADAQSLAGQHVGAGVIQEVQGPTNRDGSPNQYAGRVQSRINFFFHEGERETGFDADNGQPPTAAVAVKAAPKAQAPEAKVAPAPPAPAPKPAPAQAAAAPKVQQPIKCTICNQMVPRAEFAKHVNAHEADQE